MLSPLKMLKKPAPKKPTGMQTPDHQEVYVGDSLIAEFPIKEHPHPHKPRLIGNPYASVRLKGIVVESAEPGHFDVCDDEGELSPLEGWLYEYFISHSPA